MDAAGRKRLKSGEGQVVEQKWMSAHMEKCSRSGASWWDRGLPSEELMQLYPGLRRLTSRQLDLIRTEGVAIPDLSEPPALMDISQEREPKAFRGISPCVTPKGMLYHSQQCRRLCGYEALRLQGFLFPLGGERDLKLRNDFESEFLHNLAGNAFSVHCALASVLAAVTTLAVAVGSDSDAGFATVWSAGDVAWRKRLTAAVWGSPDSDSEGEGPGEQSHLGAGEKAASARARRSRALT
jgi:hypothetical protein